MLDLNMNSAITTHVDRIKPQMSVDSSGRVTWMPNLTDYNADVFYRGRKVTNEEFNALFLQGVYQSNYITDSLTEFFTNHLGTAVYREFTAAFNLAPSYIKTFDTADWGTLQDDGYYYITIPVSEHGFILDEDTQADTMNIDTEMYLLDEATGKFFEVDQVETAEDNTVTLYTDDNTLSGFVVIRTNDKAYALTAPTIDATQVTGLTSVATSARYTDLIDINAADGPNTRLTKNETAILNILNGDSVVGKANQANIADTVSLVSSNSLIQGMPASNIFEQGSNYVYKARYADQAYMAEYATRIGNSALIYEDTDDGETVTSVNFSVERTLAVGDVLELFGYVLVENGTSVIPERIYFSGKCQIPRIGEGNRTYMHTVCATATQYRDADISNGLLYCNITIMVTTAHRMSVSLGHRALQFNNDGTTTVTQPNGVRLKLLQVTHYKGD